MNQRVDHKYYNFQSMITNGVKKHYELQQNEPDLSMSTIVNTMMEDYLLFINVAIGCDADPDDFIYVYEIGNDKLMKSEIIWPRYRPRAGKGSWIIMRARDGHSGAIITRDKDRESLLGHGYVKDCYKDNKVENVLSIPHNLCDLISKWVLIETLHFLLIRDDTDCPHFTIDVDTIISSAK